MGKNELGNKEITQLLNEGWRIRKKKVKNRIYMTIRKGDREKGLGLYDDEKFTELTSEQKSVQSIETSRREHEKVTKTGGEKASRLESIRRFELFTDKLEKQLAKIQLYRGVIKMAHCTHVYDRYCTFWNWEEKEQIPTSLRFKNPIWEPEFNEINLPVTNKRRWVVRAATSFCQYCSMFKQRE